MQNTVVLLLLLLSSPALAAGSYSYNKSNGVNYLKLGGSTDYESLATNKFIAVGHQDSLFGPFSYQLEAGYLVDNSQVNRGQTLYLSPGLGVSINQPSYYVKVFTGPAVTTHQDDRLSTPWEFNSDFEIGLKDDRNVGVGIGFKHMSNAGLCNNCSNLGRDYIYFKVQIP